MANLENSSRIAIAGRGPMALLTAHALANRHPDLNITVIGPEAVKNNRLPISTRNILSTFSPLPESTPHASELQVGTHKITVELSRRASRFLFNRSKALQDGLYAPRINQLEKELEAQIKAENPNVTIINSKLNNFELTSQGVKVNIDGNIEDFDLLISATGIAGKTAKILKDRGQLKEIIRKKHTKTLGLYVNLPDEMKKLLPAIDNRFYYSHIKIDHLGTKGRLYITPATDGTYLVLLGSQKNAIDDLLKKARENNPTNSSFENNILEAIKIAASESSFSNFLSNINSEHIDEATLFNMNEAKTRMIKNKEAKERIILLGDEERNINPAWGIGLLLGIKAIVRLIKIFDKANGDISKIGRLYNSKFHVFNLKVLTYSMDLLSSLFTGSSYFIKKYLRINI